MLKIFHSLNTSFHAILSQLNEFYNSPQLFNTKTVTSQKINKERRIKSYSKELPIIFPCNFIMHPTF